MFSRTKKERINLILKELHIAFIALSRKKEEDAEAFTVSLDGYNAVTELSALIFSEIVEPCQDIK